MGSLIGATSGATYQLLGCNGSIGGSGTAAFQLAPLPNRAAGYLSFPSGLVDLNITKVDFLHWSGAAGSAWDTTSANWKLNSNAGTTAFINGSAGTGGDSVVFDNAAGPGHSSVTLATTVFPSSVTVSSSNTYAFSGTGSIGGPTALTINGPGSVTLATSNGYTGGTNITGGVLNDGAANSFGLGALTVGGGTVNVYNAQSPSSVNIMGGVLNLASPAATLGNGPVVMSPTGSATLYIPGPTCAIGTLSNTGTGSSNIVLGSASSASAATLTINQSTATTFGGTISDFSASNPAASGALLLAGNSALTLTASNSYTGGTTVSAGTLIAANDFALGSGPVAMNPAAGTAALAFVAAAPSIGSLSSSGAGTSLVVLGNASAPSATMLAVGGNNASTTFSGTIGDLIANDSAAAGGIVKTGSGTWTLNPNAPNSYSGGTIVNQGTLVLSYANENANTGTIGGPLTINPGATVTVTVPKGIGFASVSPHGVTTLSISGGLLNYSGTTSAGSTYGLGGGQTVYLTGGTIESNGGVSSPTARSFYRFCNAVGPNGDYTIYTLASATPSVMSGGIELSNPATFNVAAGGTLLVSAAIFNNATGGAGAISESGSGLLVLSGSNTYTGGTDISGGTLQLGTGQSGQDGSIADTSGVTDNAALVYDLFGSQGASYSISGSGALATIGSGTLTLSGTNYYTGGTTIASGMLILNNAAAIADGTSLTVGDPAAFITPAPVVPALPMADGTPASRCPVPATLTPVPEPGTLALVAAVAAGWCAWRRRNVVRT